MLYARKGEVITCENGHRIGVFNRDVTTDETTCADQIDWLIPSPKEGDQIGEPLCECGAAWANIPAENRALVHIGNEWRQVTG